MNNGFIDLTWIYSQQPDMVQLLQNWAGIPSGSDDMEGLSKMATILQEAFAPLGGSMERLPLAPRTVVDNQGVSQRLPQGDALHFHKHPEAPLRIFFGGHMDTVYSRERQASVEYLNPGVLKGPGVADMKGGLVIMLTVLQALERSSLAGKIGWEVVINPDEEVGSSGSEPLLRACAKRNHVALLFEPSFPDGALVSVRKGSATYALVVKGKAAHAGRDFHAGRNAITALAQIMVDIHALNKRFPGVSINIGRVSGGEAVNIVPDLAICHFNVRMESTEALQLFQEALEEIITKARMEEGITIALHSEGARSPKNWNEKTARLFFLLETCAKELSIPFETRPTGGVCDGNILAESGVPTIDTLGVVGGHIHTAEEYCILSSLSERAALTASLLQALL